MTCKQCVHHKTVREDTFYCESHNDLFEDDESFEAELCLWFAPISNENEVQS